MTRFTWDERIAQVQTQRNANHRFMSLAGLGTPPDPLIWPILERFGALGIPTRGSCQGHIIPEDSRPPMAFVTVSQGDMDSAQHRRWLAAVDSFLAPAVMPIARFSIDVLGFSVLWHQVSQNFADERLRVLTSWANKLDEAGRHMVASDPEDWSVWVMPDVGVPAAVDPRRMETPFVAFLDTQDRQVDFVVRRRLAGWDWNAIAHQVRWAETACREAWEAFWSDWLALQSRVPIRQRKCFV